MCAAFAVIVTLAAVIALVAASVRISEVTDPAWRHVAISGELVFGVLWLLAAVYVSTHVAVLIFAKPQAPADPEPLAPIHAPDSAGTAAQPDPAASGDLPSHASHRASRLR